MIRSEYDPEAQAFGAFSAQEKGLFTLKRGVVWTRRSHLSIRLFQLERFITEYQERGIKPDKKGKWFL